MKALKVFIKPFEASQKSVKIKIQLSEMHGAEEVKVFDLFKACDRTGDHHSLKKRHAQ